MLYTIDNITIVYTVLIMLHTSANVVYYRKYCICIHYVDIVTYN